MGTTVFRGGRVVDPANGLDEVGDVLVEGARIAGVGPGLHGDVVVDVGGLVVGPGFVDLHSHADSVAGHRLKALDGVTTALELESGRLPVAAAYALAGAEGRPLHYGYSASWAVARAVAHRRMAAGGQPAFEVLADPEWQRSSTPAERSAWLSLLDSELGAGALGVGVLLGYAPHSDPAELLAVGALAEAAGVPLFVHAREPVEIDPASPADGPSELVTVASETGAHVHQCHVNSTSLRHIDRVLGLHARARALGDARLTVEAYPYGAGSTAVGAVFLEPDGLPAWGIEPRAIVLLPSGERVADAARLREVRATAPETLCVIQYLDEDDPVDLGLLDRSLEFPDAIVASDSMPLVWADGRADDRSWPLPPGGLTHPRTAGTFARALRRFVRETGRWDWTEAFRRCSLLPARVLDFAGAARGKGHLSVGADADLVAIDPATVSDAASYLDPAKPSVGVRHLLVAGTFVVRDGALVADAFPGRPVRAGTGR